MRPIPRLTRLLPLVITMALVGCATPQPGPETAHAGSASSAPERHDVVQALYRQHEDWAGTPYRLGSASRAGIDCSAFVQTTYRHRFERALPRTTRAQTRVGDAVSRDAVAPGDLLFFRTGVGKRHVGIYVEDGRFLHASTSEGVTLSRLDSPYWSASYWMARRP